MPDGVHIHVTRTDPEGQTHFDDETIAYTDRKGPLRVTAPLPAASISFRETPGDFHFDFHRASRRQLVLVTSGALEITVSSGEVRVFRPGDILSLRDTWGQGHVSRAVDGAPLTAAFVNLDDEVLIDRREGTDSSAEGGVDFLHNQETEAGLSFFTRRRLPFVVRRPEGRATDDIPLSGFQFAWAAGDFAYDWHPAPQRQIVLVLTGGLAMEYGDGSSAVVPPGGFLVGEDIKGRGHITRALDGAERLSLFAHLAETTQIQEWTNI